MGPTPSRRIFWCGSLAVISLWGLLATEIQGADKPAAKPAPAPRGYVAYRARQPIKVDGKLDDADWKSAPWTQAFVDIEGSRRPNPRFRTRAKMLWDDEFLYVAAQLDEPHVWGTLTKHESVIFQDNDFEVFIDPDGDNHEYYEIEMNALNTEWDLFLKRPYRNGGPAINEWEVPGLKTGVHVEGTLNDPKDTDQYWSVELAIPWKVMAEYAHRPSPPRDGDQWRINFSRVEWRHEVADGKYKKTPGREDNWVWSQQGAIDMHRPEHWGFVQFSTAEPGTAKYQPDPAGPIRDRLMRIYSAQQQHRNKTKAWATDVKDLNLEQPPAGFPEHRVELNKDGENYEASITFTPPGKAARTLKIRPDSRITEVSESTKR
ncbi:MAG: hypothetical protein ABS79_06710 [Planctomycetes bacterium SCN 63-9]|nr:MAG: hypothetical protein ABS79_06710 [Planctomycetes bacterium SCN 63-9]